MFFDMLCISHINFPLALYNYVTELLRIVDRSRGTWSLSSGGKSGKNVGSTNKRLKPMIYNALTMLWHSDDINVPRYIHTFYFRWAYACTTELLINKDAVELEDLLCSSVSSFVEMVHHNVRICTVPLHQFKRSFLICFTYIRKIKESQDKEFVK